MRPIRPTPITATPSLRRAVAAGAARRSVSVCELMPAVPLLQQLLERSIGTLQQSADDNPVCQGKRFTPGGRKRGADAVAQWSRARPDVARQAARGRVRWAARAGAGAAR